MMAAHPSYHPGSTLAMEEATAVTEAQKPIERDNVVCIIGEISSASALAIGEQAARYKKIAIRPAQDENPCTLAT